MADDSKDNSAGNEPKDISYVRKKNIIPGIDNDHLIIGGLVTLTGLVAMPYIKQVVDGIMRNLPQPQAQAQQAGQPPNGGGIPQINIPGPQDIPQNQNPQVNYVPQQSPGASALEEHERGLREQQAYAAALEKESITGSQSINMVPDRNLQAQKKQRGYEAGSNVSAGYT